MLLTTLAASASYIAVPATMLCAYALLAGTAAWAGANRRPAVR